MARATLSVQTLTHGLAPTYTAIVAANDAQFAYDPDAFLHVKNTDTDDPIVLTIPTNQLIDGDLTVPSRTITLPALGAKFTETFPKETYRQSDNMVYLNAPADGLEIAVLKVQ